MGYELDMSEEQNIPFSPVPDDYIQSFIDELDSDEIDYELVT